MFWKYLKNNFNWSLINYFRWNILLLNVIVIKFSFFRVFVMDLKNSLSLELPPLRRTNARSAPHPHRTAPSPHHLRTLTAPWQPPHMVLIHWCGCGQGAVRCDQGAVRERSRCGCDQGAVKVWERQKSGCDIGAVIPLYYKKTVNVENFQWTIKWVWILIRNIRKN